MFGVTAVTATLIAAAIGGLTAIAAGAVTQQVRFRLERTARNDDRALDDLIRLQDTLSRLNRLYHRVLGPSHTLPDGLWEEFTSVRGEALALNERVIDTELRQKVEEFRTIVSVRPVGEDAKQRFLAQAETLYDDVQKALGESIRKRLS